MMRSLWISKTGMEAQQTAAGHHLEQPRQRLDERLQAFARGVRGPDVPEPAPGRRRRAATRRRCRPACRSASARARSRPRATSARATCSRAANPLDVAIRGNGFFQMQMPDGTTGYTRDGSFQVSATGQLVTNTGYTVQPGITIPATAQSVTIGNDGTVSVVLPGQATAAAGRPAAGRAASSTRPASSPRAQNLLHRDRRVGHAERRRPGARTAWARCSRASSRPRTSTSSRSWCR